MEYGPRIIEKKMEKWFNRREFVLLRGPRQAGKTTLFLHLRDILGGRYVTLEDEDMLHAFENSPHIFVERFGDSRIIFVDGAQYSKKAGKILKLIYDTHPEVKIFATGSGSFDIKVEVGKYLVGRAVYFELFPLNFEEFLMWRDESLHRVFVEYRNALIDFIDGRRDDIPEEPPFRREFEDLLQEHVVFGGFPAVVKEKDEEMKKELLHNLYTTYLERDVFFFLNVRHMEKFRNLMRYLSFIDGGILELSGIARDMKMDYRTVENYISILTNTYVVNPIAPFHRNMTSELKKAKKIYFVDTGLRNAILNNFLPLESRADAGKLLENFILNELRPLGDVRHWRTAGGAEADFILMRNGKVIPIEVKHRGRQERGFLSFLEKYRPERGVVFTTGQYGTRKMRETVVAFVPHWVV